MRAGSGFGVVLDAEDGGLAVAHAFDGAVVEVQLAHAHVRLQVIAVDGGRSITL